MKKTTCLIALAVLSTALFAQPPAVAPAVTLQEEIELYGAISSLDRGTTKIIDGKPQGVPFVFTAATRFALAIDAGLVKPKAETYQNMLLATRSRIDPKGPTDRATDNDKAQQINAELTPIFAKIDDKPPTFQKIALADLNLDANPIPFDTLTKLRLIIQQ